MMVRMMVRRSRGLKGGVNKVLHHLVGEICCVTKPISGGRKGLVRIWGSDFPAAAEAKVARGRWVRVISHGEGVLHVVPLNVWLGSCCC
jgi:membrane protein implicated in regulation of membrane protease activity